MVLDIELLAEFLGQLLRDQPRNDVGRAGRRERHDHPNWLGRIILRASGAADQQGRYRGKNEKANRYHVAPNSFC